MTEIVKEIHCVFGLEGIILVQRSKIKTKMNSDWGWKRGISYVEAMRTRRGRLLFNIVLKVPAGLSEKKKKSRLEKKKLNTIRRQHDTIHRKP